MLRRSRIQILEEVEYGYKYWFYLVILWWIRKNRIWIWIERQIWLYQVIIIVLLFNALYWVFLSFFTCCSNIVLLVLPTSTGTATPASIVQSILINEQHKWTVPGYIFVWLKLIEKKPRTVSSSSSSSFYFLLDSSTPVIGWSELPVMMLLTVTG